MAEFAPLFTSAVMPDDPAAAVAWVAACRDNDPNDLARMLAAIIGLHCHATSLMETSLVVANALTALQPGGRA